MYREKSSANKFDRIKKKREKILEPFTDNGGEKTRTPETHNDDLQKIPHTKSWAIGPHEDVLTSVKRPKLK